MNDNINKECWVKNTQYKFLGFVLFEKKEILDSSNFAINQEDSFYCVPDIFNTKTKS